MPTSSLHRRSSNKAAALIIVLAFVVLLTGLAVAYLSRATTDRQLAQSSFHDTDADLLARSALDIVVGDFKQEIVNGSAKTPVSSGGGLLTTIYVPTDTVPPRKHGSSAWQPARSWCAQPYSAQRQRGYDPLASSSESRLGRQFAGLFC